MPTVRTARPVAPDGSGSGPVEVTPAVRTSASRTAPTFHSRRFDVRPWTRGDLVAVHQVLGDPRVVWWDDEAGPLTHSRLVLERIRHATAHGAAGAGWFAIVERETGAVVGNVLLRQPAVETDGVEIGWHVRVDDQGRGIATEVARAAIEHARAHLGATRVVALISVGNLPSERVAAKLGMRPSEVVPHLGRPHRLHVLDLPVGDRGG
jgi:RimJ/RimL family protein N-acetyltransferase